jgi:parallel beta-helix repeat protein
MKRTPIQFICIILIFMLGTFATQAGAKVLIVDSSGGGNHTLIQEAVEGARTGDIIIVNPGVYRENIIVDKDLTILSNLSLSSNDTNRTFIIGAASDSDVIDIYSNNVTIEGFYIIGGSSGMERDLIGINLESVENCSVSNSTLVLNDIGICLNNSTSNYLDNNLVSLGKKGISLVDSSENMVSNNTVIRDSYGFSLNNSTNNTLINNTAEDNILGISLVKSEGNIFTYNTLRGNAYAINGEAAKSNFIINNTVSLNDIGINLNGSLENTIYENRFSNFLDVVDDGKNIWNSSSKGNFWHNYSGQDADGDGIGDTPYVVNQTTESIDYMPIFSINNTENANGNVSQNMWIMSPGYLRQYFGGM